MHVPRIRFQHVTLAHQLRRQRSLYLRHERPIGQRPVEQTQLRLLLDLGERIDLTRASSLS
jgi:hypothetical protein